MEKDDTKSIGIAHDSKAHRMLFENIGDTTQSYFLSSPYIGNDIGYINFGLYVIGGGNVVGCMFDTSAGGTYGRIFGVRPVVSLRSDVQLEKEGDVWKIQ